MNIANSRTTSNNILRNIINMLREVRNLNHIKCSIKNRMQNKMNKKQKNQTGQQIENTVVTNVVNIKATLSIIILKINGLNIHIETIRMD